jgi:hypothetical protein
MKIIPVSDQRDEDAELEPQRGGEEESVSVMAPVSAGQAT